ncbi:MAG TPA: VCBS repeat-containing protein [Myxococcales bacterium]|nr:VCBS repeat-containing protein [Myxococcales bacterium]
MRLRKILPNFPPCHRLVRNERGWGRRCLRAGVLVVALLAVVTAVPFAASSAEPFFEISSIPNADRSAAVNMADLNGNGRIDLLVVVMRGLPPEEEREARIHFQSEQGTFSPQPDYVRAIPTGASVYDLADVRSDSPGSELILLRPGGLTLLSLASKSAPRWDLEVSGPATAGIGDDERGFEYFKMVQDGFGDEPVLFVQQIGQLTILTPKGEVRGQMQIPRRANYLIIPTGGLISIESNFQIFLDVPKILLGDIDGDGLTDLAVATRHEVDTYLQREGGHFPNVADRKQALRLITKEDHIRGSGGVTADVGDVNGDGRIDLLLSYAKGGFRNTETLTYYYQNRDGGWAIGEPDHTFRSDASLASNALVDLDNDGRMEMVRLELDFSLLELIEILLSREFDVEVSVFDFDGSSGFKAKAASKKKIELPFSTATFRLKGFFPSVRADLNGDGYQDFVTSGEGDELSFQPGGPKGPFASRRVRQKMSTERMIHFTDWSGDGLTDLVIFDPQRYAIPISIVRNLGRLPGTPEALQGAVHDR